MADYLITEVAEQLRKNLAGEVSLDPTTRLLYSTDASIYQVEPLGVVFPRTPDDLAAAVEIAAEHQVPILPRGSGSSLAGQAVGAALILDCTRYLNQILEIDSESHTALVEPGVVLNRFNRQAAKHGLKYGPDPASADRATFGGMMGNNSTGAHSILYGMTADHILSSEVVLSDGSMATLESLPLSEATRRADSNSLEGSLYRVALRIREQCSEAIRERWPRTWRRSSGYSLNYLLPWSASQPPRWSEGRPYPPISPEQINLAPLLVGSEGTLAVFRRAKVNLVPLPKHSVLAVLPYDSVAEASEATPAILELQPSAVELVPQSLIRLARAVPAYAHRLSFVQGDPAALLIVEFSGDSPTELKKRAQQLGSGAVIAESPAEQEQIWAVRKVGLGLLMSRPGDYKPLPFIEDIAVPVERLGEFVREIERIIAERGVQGDFYAHASAGCLHVRPLVNLKTRLGVGMLRSITAEAVKLALRLGAALSGEHGDGLARSEWLEEAFGPEILQAFRELKAVADPRGILNPGKVLGAPPMDENLRYGANYRASTWQPVFDYSHQGGFLGAVEMCNGAGVCRKAEGVMCPSFRATGDEVHSTRGRANLLRGLFSGRMPTGVVPEAALHQALDLCLECKGCKAECPSAVDMAKLKYEFLHHYYESHRRPLRDYLFAHIDKFARLGRSFAGLANPLLQSDAFRFAGAKLFGLAQQRVLPKLHRGGLGEAAIAGRARAGEAGEAVLFLSDAFTEYFYPQVGRAALKALALASCEVRILPVLGSGRTFISKGFLAEAKRHAARLLGAIAESDLSNQMAIVGVEPSEIYTLKDEYPDFFPGDARVAALAERTFLLDEFLLRPGPAGRSRIEKVKAKAKPEGERKPVFLHGHCYQKAQPPTADGYPSGVEATREMLAALGYPTEVIPSGCCGMAGSFGYEAGHYELSMQIGEMELFPAVRAAGDEAIVAAPGFSCRAQIQQGTGRAAVHPLLLI